MNAIDVAASLGVSERAAWDYLTECDEVVESERFVATRKGTTVHLAVELKGLGGRRIVRECRKTLRPWFDRYAILHAPVKHGNERAIRMATALGFYPYAVTEKHIWLAQTKEHFNGN